MKISKTELYEVINKCIKKVLKEAIQNEEGKTCLNEGPGAGYNLAIKGITCSDVRITKTNEEGTYFSAKIGNCPIEFVAEGYDWYVSSEEEGEVEVLNGYIKGFIDENVDEEKISEILYNTKFEKMIGGGYVFQKLNKVLEINDEKFYQGYHPYSIEVEEFKITSPSLAEVVNNAYDTRYDDYDDYENED